MNRCVSSRFTDTTPPGLRPGSSAPMERRERRGSGRCEEVSLRAVLEAPARVKQWIRGHLSCSGSECIVRARRHLLAHQADAGIRRYPSGPAGLQRWSPKRKSHVTGNRCLERLVLAPNARSPLDGSDEISGIAAIWKAREIERDVGFPSRGCECGDGSLWQQGLARPSGDAWAEARQ